MKQGLCAPGEEGVQTHMEILALGRGKSLSYVKTRRKKRRLNGEDMSEYSLKQV